MNKLFKILFMTVLILSLTSLVNGQSIQLTGDFVGTVRIGPDAGQIWQGLLTLNITQDGAVTGMLENASESINVSGTLIGQSITLLFEVAPDTYVIGTGGLNRTIDNQPGFMGGTLSGPNEGDIGDWGYGIGG